MNLRSMFSSLAQPSEVGRIARLLICSPQLRARGAALQGVGVCASRAACGAADVVELVGLVGGMPVWRCGHGMHFITHSMKTRAASALMALP